MNDPAWRSVAEASAKQMDMDKMVTDWANKMTPERMKTPALYLYTLNDIIINKRITFTWNF